MRQDTAAILQRINWEFYQTFADAFAGTRRRLQPGAQRAIGEVPQTASVLDLGCGAGELARGLAKCGHHGSYLGIDASPALLELARQRAPYPWARFQLADLARDDWASEMSEGFDRVFLLAVIHHIPGQELRKHLLENLAAALATAGSVTLSVWDFEKSSRMRKRIISWEVVGLSPTDVDAGDYLLDWRHGGLGLRYVHLFAEDELRALAERTGFRIVDVYRSDGEGGRLGLYQTWVRAKAGIDSTS
jgi:tRNA (uracil-5-)-methyltransferase TRM9